MGFRGQWRRRAALDTLMDGRDPLVVVDIVVPEAELVHRLVSRFVCDDCGTNAEGVTTEASGTTRCVRCGGRLKQRSDDNASVVLERFKVYHRDTQPLVDYYKARSTFRAVNGAQPPDRVATDLAKAIDRRQRQRCARGEQSGDCLPLGRRARTDARRRDGWLAKC